MPLDVTRSLALAAILACGSPAPGTAPALEGPYAPRIRAADFVAQVDHPYLPLVPGTRFRYVEYGKHDRLDNEVEVTKETKVILGVKCVVVHDRVLSNGKALEDTFDWYAQDRAGNVWYFGEATREYENGKASTAGSWQAGVKGAKPGIVMPAVVTPGDPYRQEYAPGEAEDVGQIMGDGDQVVVPFGRYGDALKIKEWSLIEPGSEFKWFARGIGLVRAESAGGRVTELVNVEPPAR